MRSVLERMARAGHPPLHTRTPQEARIAYQAGADVLEVPKAALARVEDLQIPARDGAMLPARLYAPSTDKGLPVLLYTHGGGFTIGNIATHDILCRELARLAGCLVVSLDYRLAPEHRFPTASNDAWDALQWLAANAERLGADPQRLAVGGDSAGGNLAAALCLALRAAGQRQPCAQALVYPVLSAQALPSHRRCADAPLLSHAELQACLDIYLANPEQRHNPLALPLAASDFVGLAPAFVAAAEFDPLRDDAARYAERLALDGVPVLFEPGPGLVHGCLRGLGRVAEVDRLYQRLCAWLATAI